MKKRPRIKCRRCGKDVAVQTSGRSAAPGEPFAHKCPHGQPCMETASIIPPIGYRCYCLECEAKAKL